jgi:hypothetical protein
MAGHDELHWWKGEVARLRDELRRLQNAHAVLQEREWFAIKCEDPNVGRGCVDDQGRYTLFFCDRNGTFPCCTLGPRDVLLVGRYTGESEREAAVTALAGNDQDEA